MGLTVSVQLWQSSEDAPSHGSGGSTWEAVSGSTDSLPDAGGGGYGPFGAGGSAALWGDGNASIWDDLLDNEMIFEQAGPEFSPPDPGDVPAPCPPGTFCAETEEGPPAEQVESLACYRQGGPFELPDFSSLIGITQDCFVAAYGTTGWPPADCPPPCLDPRPCAVPTRAAGNAAPMDVVIVDETQMPIPPGQSRSIPRNWKPYAPGTTEADIPDEVALFRAVAAFLADNIDIVEWVVCLATTWSPGIPNHQAYVDCMVDAVLGGMNIYLVDTFVDKRTGVEVGANGVATGDQVEVRGGAMQDGGSGAVIAAGHPKIPGGAALYQAAAAAYVAALGREGDAFCIAALCAVSHAASAVLHELMHQCTYEQRGGIYGPSGSPTADALPCWAVQNMVGRSFTWAIAQRYPDLQLALCCPANEDTWFMHSEEGEAAEMPPFPYQPNLC